MKHMKHHDKVEHHLEKAHEALKKMQDGMKDHSKKDGKKEQSLKEAKKDLKGKK